MNGLISVFSTRELAVGLWSLAVLIFALSYGRFRKSLWKLLTSFLQWKILAFYFGMAVYSATVVYGLSCAGVWSSDLLKDTVLWLILGASMTGLHVVTASREDNVWRRVVVDNLKIVIVLEFLVNTYTFSLGVEVLLIPAVSLVAIMNAVASTDERHDSVRRLASTVLAMVGAVIVSAAIWRAIGDLKDMASYETLRSVLLAPTMSVLLLPFLYVSVVMMEYESFGIRLKLFLRDRSELIQWTRHRVRRRCGLSLRRVRTVSQIHPRQWMSAMGTEDIDRLIERQLKA